MRKALIVGIDYYSNFCSLNGCVNDATNVYSILSRNFDNSLNFSANLLTSKDQTAPIKRRDLRNRIQDLFSGDSDIALFYFAGHGHIESTGGYILASDDSSGDEGIPLSDVITFANNSKAKNRIIVLDSCHSGIAGSTSSNISKAELTEGTTILTASTAEQYATEEDGSGIFTTLFVDALSGAAGNLVGDVTPGSIYAHIDQSLGPWDQRPVFKTNVKSFVSLRKVEAPISLRDLQQIVNLFPTPGFEFKLDPTYEPERHPGDNTLPPPNPANVGTFSILQMFNRTGLLTPVGEKHMWHAAINSKSCKLTVLGEHYRRLVANGRI